LDRKLVWTEKASSDIEAIVRYIARRDPSAAARIGLAIYDRAQILLQHPEAGSGRVARRRVAETYFRRWKIVYTIRWDTVIIGRAWPAAMGEADLETPL
jgi:plasmid stabilization system protein ParE